MSEVEIIPLVSINAIRTSVEGIDNEKLVNEILSTQGELDEKFLDDEHHTYYEDKRYPYGMPEAEKLLNILTQRVNELVGKKLILSEAWTLTLEDGQSVAAHSHKSNQAIHQEEYYSIAYYPSAPENSADLIFLVTACNTVESSIVVKPKVGDLVIFNSYLMHMTNRHRNKNEKRIVISANFIPEQPNKTPNQDWSAYARKVESLNNKKLIHHYELVVSTIFGDELVNLFLYEDNTGLAANHSSQMNIPSWTLIGGVLDIRFDADVPMNINIHLRTAQDGHGNVYGFLFLGNFGALTVNGKKVQ